MARGCRIVAPESEKTLAHGLFGYTLVDMSIQIRLRSPSLQIEAYLAPAALPAILKLVEEHGVSKPSGEFMGFYEGRPEKRRRDRGEARDRACLPAEQSERAQSVFKHLENLSPATLLAKTGPTTLPEKFILAIGWFEARYQHRPRRDEVRRTIGSWPIDPSANPSRDFKIAVELGWIGIETPAIGLTDAGWLRIGELLGLDSNGGMDSVLV